MGCPGTEIEIQAVMLVFGRFAALSLCAASLACSTAESIPIEPIVPDTPLQPTATCKVSIHYPDSNVSVIYDELYYDEDGRLLESYREFADGAAAQRQWSYDADGTATREWFDGSKVIRFDEAGRVAQTETFNAYGGLEWVEELSYSDAGEISERLLTKVVAPTAENSGIGEMPWMQSSYRWDSEMSGQAEVASLVYEDDRRIIGYHTVPDGEHTKLVESHDVDADGVNDFKTAVLIDDDGKVLRGVDERGQLIDFEYEGGDSCAVAASLWQLGNPFFVDL